MLAAIGDHHLTRVDDIPAVAPRLVRNGLAQIGQAGSRRVLVVANIPGCGDCGLDDVIRSRKVGLARPEADDRKTLRLEGVRLRGDRKRGRWRYRLCPQRNTPVQIFGFGGHLGTLASGVTRLC